MPRINVCDRSFAWSGFGFAPNFGYRAYVIFLEQGAIACIAALSIRNSFSAIALRLFTFGENIFVSLWRDIAEYDYQASRGQEIAYSQSS